MQFVIMQICSSLTAVMLICSLTARAESTHNAGRSPHDFVEKFYSWYVPRARNEDTTSGWNETLRLARSDVSSQLAESLAEDTAAQSKCKDLIGLDFDPFLYTQEPAEHYEVGRISQTKTAYRAEIYTLESRERAEKAAVIAEFMQKDGHWFFVNFYYPGGNDLLTVLKSRPQCKRLR